MVDPVTGVVPSVPSVVSVSDTGSPSASEEPAPPPDRETLVRSAVGEAEGEIQKRPYGFKVRVNLSSERKQIVRVVFDRSDPDGDPALLVYTVCGGADEKRFRWALKVNARLPYGALALREVEGKEQFILINTLPEADTTRLELRKVILTLAEKGDVIEKRLTGKDRY